MYLLLTDEKIIEVTHKQTLLLFRQCRSEGDEASYSIKYSRMVKNGAILGASKTLLMGSLAVDY